MVMTRHPIHCAWSAIAAFVVLNVVFATLASTKECQNEICLTALCEYDPPGLGISTTSDTIPSPSSQVPIRKPTHYNVRSRSCLNEQQQVGLQSGAIRLPSGCDVEIQVCEKGEATTPLTRARSKCSAWVAFHNFECPKQIPSSVPKNKECEPAQYGTEDCPYPSFGEPPSAAVVAFCKNYAKKAAAAARTWRGLDCGNDDPLWSTDFHEHLNWCIVLNGDQGQPNAKAAARESALGSCRELAAQKRQLEVKPQVPIGEVTKPVDPLDKAGVFEK